MPLDKEMLEIYKKSEKSGAKAARESLRRYKSAQDSILAEIAKIAMEYNENGNLKISHAQRLKVLASLSKKLREHCGDLAKDDKAALTDTLTNVIDDAYISTAYAIDKGIEINKSFALLSKEFIDTALSNEVDGKTFSKRIWDNCNALANRVKDDVSRAMIQGTSTEKLARQIKNDFGSTAYQAKRLINTEVARAVTTAQEEAFKNSGVVSMVMWTATLEDNTCNECAQNDGQYFAVDNHPALPAHPGCRCALVPVVQGWEPYRRLDNSTPSIGKETVDYTTVAKWKESRGL